MTILEWLAVICGSILALWYLIYLVRRSSTIVGGKNIQDIHGVKLRVEAEHNRKFPYDEI